MIGREIGQNQEDPRQVGLRFYGLGHLHSDHHIDQRPRCREQSATLVVPNQLSAYDSRRALSNYVCSPSPAKGKREAGGEGARKDSTFSLTAKQVPRLDSKAILGRVP